MGNDKLVKYIFARLFFAVVSKETGADDAPLSAPESPAAAPEAATLQAPRQSLPARCANLAHHL